MITKPLLFIDFETTGLDPFNDEIVEVAYYRLSHEDVMKRRFSLPEVKQLLVLPINPNRAFMKTNGICAADINGFNIKEWEKNDAIRWTEASQILSNAIKGSRWVGANPCFDYRFYTNLCNRHHIRPTNPGDYHLCDISSMAYTLHSADVIPNTKLDTILKHFDMERKYKKHSAVEDVYLTMHVYRQFCFE